MNQNARLRLAVIGVITLSLFAALFARLWYLQVMDSATFQVAAQANQVRIVYEEAPRGRIIDRQGRVLVDNVVTEVVTVSRQQLAEEREVVVPRLAALLAIPVDELEKRLNDQRFSPYKPIPVAEGIEDWKAVYLREHSTEFPGVEVTQLATRHYPHGNLAAHVLGYAGEINDSELTEREELGYRQGDTIGKTGVERSYEDDLRGAPGVSKLEVDSGGKVLRSLFEQPPVQGDDVQLTIDLDVQRLAEESLGQGIEAARRSWDPEGKKHFLAPAGAVVVMDPRDGSVLAMASFPTFDPSAFVNGISRTVFRQLQDPAGHYPLNNRALSGLYAPGSTFKLVTALAGLRSGLVTERTTMEDTGSYKLRSCRGNKCVFRNAGSRSYGKVNLHRAMAVSSDVYFYSLGAEFWFQRDKYGDAIQEAAEDLGLGAKTGIPLPGELKGRIPDPQTRRELHELRPDAFPNGDWYAGDNLNLAIGQGETVASPLQLANAYAAFVNGGSLYQPRIAAQIVGRKGQLVRAIEPRTLRALNLDPNLTRPIIAGMRGAVVEERGTALDAFRGFPFSSLSVGGKTGTAQVVGKQDTALFVGIAPVDNPQYVISVVMEEGGFGGSTAAPVARRIFEGLAGQPPGPITLVGATD